MEAAPVSIFSTLAPWDILSRLGTIKIEAADLGEAIPEGIVRELFSVLESKLPEVGPAIEELPAGELTSDGIGMVPLRR